MAVFVPSTVFLLGISILGSVFGVLCLALYSEIDENPKTIMAKFKLHPEKTLTDFRQILLGNGGTTLFLALFSLGTALQHQNLVYASYVGITISVLLVVDVIASWVFEYT